MARTRALWTASKAPPGAAPAYVPESPPWWQAALALGVALFVQGSLAPALTVRGAVPPLVLLVVAWYGLRAGTLRGLTFGVIAGACEDAFAGTTGAAWTLATGLGGLCAGRFAQTWAADLPPALALGAGALSVARYAVFATIVQAEGRPLALPLTHVHAALWQGAEAALLTFALVRVVPNLAGTTAALRGLPAHRR